MTTQIKFLFILLLSSYSLFGGDIHVINLKVEYIETPLGIDVEHPRFNWQMYSANNIKGCSQTGYHVIVTNGSKEIVWDSGKIKSDISLNIKYNGKPLVATTRYHWMVQVWDQHNKKHTASSWFETGLMNADPTLSAWSGAKWIGGGDHDMVLYSDYLPVFKINFTIQLDKNSKSTNAGFIYGANDNRLLDKNKNTFNIENKKDSSYILIELDITSLSTKDFAKINIYRVGYAPQDNKHLPIKSLAIPTPIINNHNKYESHTIYLSSVFGNTKIFIDGESNMNLIGDVNLNPLGRGGDFIAYPVVANIGFRAPKNQTAYFSNVQIRNFRSPSNVLFSEYSTPYQMQGKESAALFTLNPSRNSMPMLRTTFSTSSNTISKARLYVTARGVYEVYLNGNRIGNDYFNPGSTQYNKTHLYQTYDVTTSMRNGKNAMGALLGEGWWSGGSTYMGELWNYFGDRQSLLAKLVITYTNGKEDVIITTPATWKYFNNGPIVYGSFFQGEVYDASKEALIKDWTTAPYDDSDWKQATEINLETQADPGNDYNQMALIGQFDQPIKKIKELSAIAVDEVRPGVYVYDMGQNMAGVPKISLSNMKPGEKILMRFAEVKYPNLPAYKENAGMIMLENIRAAMAQEIYITKGGNEIINPRFTYHGYRYIEITGLENALPLNAVKGEVISSIHNLASKFETSNTLVNKLWENITWSTYANFMSIPTDCPQRNERLGWSGDISVFSRTATYLSDVSQFLRRHMLAMRDVQREDGRFPDVAPLGIGFGETMWGSAGITVAWESFQQYGDKDMLAEHYDAMKKYITYLVRDINPETGLFKEKEQKVWSSLGDWLSLEDGKNEKLLFWEAYLIYDLEIMSKVASALGNEIDARQFANLCSERKDFFNKTYIDSVTGKTSFRGKLIDTQTSYVLPFAFNIFNHKNSNAALQNFIETITRENITDNNTVCPPYSLMTGFIGTAWINKALSANQHSDAAYRLLQQTSYPSWLYPIEQGATTIWERLNSYTLTDGFGGNNGMNSFNHYSFGAIGAWMYNYSLGIDRDESSPGFKHFILHPEPDPTGKMTFARGHYNSMYGKIESSWEIKDKIYKYQFVVPANTTATVYIPVQDEKKITINNQRPSKSKGVKFLQIINGKAMFEITSGVYSVDVIRL